MVQPTPRTARVDPTARSRRDRCGAVATVGTVTLPASKSKTFRALHVPGQPLLMPNPWDAGSAKLLASLGFQALATTSYGHAAALGRLDGSIDRGEALAHASSIVSAVDVPVSADLENGFADDPDAVFGWHWQHWPGPVASCSTTAPTGSWTSPSRAVTRRPQPSLSAEPSTAGRRSRLEAGEDSSQVVEGDGVAGELHGRRGVLWC